ncbi:MAG: PaaI family thioesterase [Pseudomonadota bacterium]
MSNGEPVMSAKEVGDYLDKVFPEVNADGKNFSVESVGPMSAAMRLHYNDRFVRPGGTISGPAMFSLADLSLYVAVLAHIGEQALAVTTNMTINFLRKPENTDLIGTCRLLKLGKRLAVGDVVITGEETGLLVAHATGTYSIPPKK